MSQIAIVSLEDEPEVRQAIIRDLEPFAENFRIEGAEDVEDARELMESIEKDGDRVGLILCDHRLPGTTGVDFLSQLNGEDAEKEDRGIRKVLLTGQADHNDTIKAINEGGLHHYVPKPWTPERLAEVVRDQLTEFVLLSEDIDPLPYTAVLDGARLMEKVARGPRID
jgi:two-component system chemotaxis response regulator CheY